MNILKASHRIVRYTPDMLEAIDEAARTCYLSEPKDTLELHAEFKSAVVDNKRHMYSGSVALTYPTAFEYWIRDRFIRKLMKMGHQTPFEFGDIEIEFICDRGVSHEAVRHRLCSPMQESTRYCNYGEEGKHGINVIDPLFFDEEQERYCIDPPKLDHMDCTFKVEEIGHGHAVNKLDLWVMAMQFSEWVYNAMLDQGAPPQQARSVLPNSLKTKLKIKANVREWLHIFKLRAVNPGAHPQIREVMIPALKECAEKWPVLFENLMKELSNERV